MKKGYFYFVPIYFNEVSNGINGRNLIFDIMLDIMLGFHRGLCFITSLFLPDFEFTFPIKLTGDVE